MKTSIKEQVSRLKRRPKGGDSNGQVDSISKSWMYFLDNFINIGDN